MSVTHATFFDGRIAAEREVSVELTPDGLLIAMPDGTAFNWRSTGLRSVDAPVSGRQLRLAYASAPGARLLIPDGPFLSDLLQTAPHLRGGLNAGRLLRQVGILLTGILLGALAIYLLFSIAPNQLAFLMPDSWRVRLGEAVEESFTAEARQCQTPVGDRALEHLAARLREGNPDIPSFSLRVYDIPVVNAFALPGGRVVIFRELINRAMAPAEVAGVLAHELGHVSYRHAEAQLIRTVGMQLLLSLATGGNSSGSNLGGFAGLLAILSYSREAESQADSFGVHALSQAQIDPLGLKRFLEVIAKEEGKSSSDLFGRMGNMMSTHPVTADRIAAIKPATGITRDVLKDDDWQALKSICN